MTKAEFLQAGLEICTRVGISEELRGYFTNGVSRLHATCEHFELFERNLGDVLEVGPFFGFTPFILRDRATSYTILEGDDPAVYPLAPHYKEKEISLSYLDLFEEFGPIKTASHRLDLPDSSFDTVLCWETMEHFAFNPVKFVRELHRVLKPGGKAFITVPNKASFQALAALILGRGEERSIRAYYQFEDYQSNGKTAFYGFHWREYSTGELAALFEGAGFKINSCLGVTCFQDNSPPSPGRKIARWLSQFGSSIAPRFATNVFLIAQKGG